MSYEIKTRVKPDLPKGDYTVVARLMDYAGRPYTEAHASFLTDGLGLVARQAEATEGALYVALSTTNLAEKAVIEQSARPLHQSLARLALDPEILAFVIPSSQLSPERPLAESFPYLTEDVSLELRDELQALSATPLDDANFYFEVEHLADF
ncbi:MAG: hypothetical protein QFB87_05460 [Patescibacteria group bacterium]|nr:hypothetical protein [Patescibacteria group bacterium]